MKSIFTLTIMMIISSSCFAVAPFSGKIDYKVGDKIKYRSQCVVRAQFDLGAQDQTALKTAVEKSCGALMSAAGLLSNGETLQVELNGYSTTTVNCTVCAAQ